MDPTPSLPRETFRDFLNEVVRDIKFRYMPFRAYYRLRPYRYMLFKDPEMGLLRFLVDPTKNSLDVGANVGLFTHLLSRYSRHVYAFEPNPIAYRILKAVAEGNVSVLPIALSDVSGEVDFVVPRRRKGWTCNGAGIGKRADGGAAVLKIPCSRIDDLDYTGIGFIKIDVEGHEKQVLKGAIETLGRERPNLFVENEIAHVGEAFDEVFALLCDLDYHGFALIDGVLRDLHHFSPEELQIVPRRNDDKSDRYVKNFIFLPR